MEVSLRSDRIVINKIVGLKVISPELIESFASTIFEFFDPQRRSKVDADANFTVTVNGESKSSSLSCWCTKNYSRIKVIPISLHGHLGAN